MSATYTFCVPTFGDDFDSRVRSLAHIVQFLTRTKFVENYMSFSFNMFMELGQIKKI